MMCLTSEAQGGFGGDGGSHRSSIHAVFHMKHCRLAYILAYFSTGPIGAVQASRPARSWPS